MRVDRRKALHIDFGGERFYFCSHHCMHAFEVNPHEYLDRHGLTGPEAKAAGLPVHR
jgi:YHS domain-containing protein